MVRVLAKCFLRFSKQNVGPLWMGRLRSEWPLCICRNHEDLSSMLRSGPFQRAGARALRLTSQYTAGFGRRVRRSSSCRCDRRTMPHRCGPTADQCWPQGTDFMGGRHQGCSAPNCCTHGFAKRWVQHGSAMFHRAGTSDKGCLAIAKRRLVQHDPELFCQRPAKLRTYVEKRR